MSSKRVFSKLTAKTHMPFFNDGTLIFCMNETPAFLPKSPDDHSQATAYRPWRLYRADWATKTIVPVPTFLPDGAVLCNPTFFKEGNELQVSFIGGLPSPDGFNYRLYAMRGSSWETLGEPARVSEQFARTGFVSPRHFCLGGDRTLRLFDRLSRFRFTLTTTFDGIARATFDPQQPSRLLITGASDGTYKTLLYDVDADTVRQIVGTAPVYKACLVGNRVVFSYRESEEIEDFQLHVAPLELQPTSDSVSLQKS